MLRIALHPRIESGPHLQDKWNQGGLNFQEQKLLARTSKIYPNFPFNGQRLGSQGSLSSRP